jgi:type I restriction enzyme S subunit
MQIAEFNTYIQTYPDDWSETKLEFVADVNPESLGIDTPHSFEFRYIDIASVSSGVIDWESITTQIFHSSPSRARRVVRPNDVLLCTVRPGLQAHTFADWQESEGYICSTGFAVLHAKKDFNPRFLYHLIFSEIVSKQIRQREVGSNYPAVNESDVRALCLPLPPTTSEQQKIAQILDTIDQLIALTDTHITKLKKTKAGLLHDLLTRGIDEHGELRDPSRHPEQFQDSPLGRIPKDWEFGKLCNFYASPARNGLYKPAEYYGQGNLMIHMPQMFRGLEIDASDAARVEVSSDELERFGLRQGDLVFARRSLNLEGAGRCSLVPQLNEATTFESSIIRVRLSKDELVPTFANYFLNSEIGERLRLPLIRQVAVSGVSSEDIASLPIPKPLFEEQNRIISQIETYEKLIQTKELQQEKLKLLKKGLMTDLLTGKVRVKTEPTEDN